MITAVFTRPITLEQQRLSRTQSSLLNIFWSGFILYTASFTFGTTNSVNQSLIDACQVLGILLFFPALLGLIKFRIANRYLLVVYILYCCWLLVVVLRGFPLDYVTIKKNLFDPNNSIFLYIVPLIILMPTGVDFYRKAFGAIILISICYLLYDFIFFRKLIQAQAGDESSRDVLDYFAKTLGLPAGFLLISYVYHSKKVVALASATILITFLLTVICGRRGLMFISGVVLMFTFFIYTYENRRQLINVTISVFALALVGLYAVGMFYDDDVKIFNYTKGRIDEDTRSSVEIFFYDDMEHRDWLVGRGMNGLVAAPFNQYEENTAGLPGYREGIETDYLKIILKGGILSLGLLLFIAVPAVLLGLFYSSNILSKAAALWIILWILSLYPTNVTNFTFNYLIVWMSIGICYSKSIRTMPEDQLRQLLCD